jgi:hypothetical protein
MIPIRIYIEIKDVTKRGTTTSVITFKNTDEVAGTFRYLMPWLGFRRWVVNEETGDVWMPGPNESINNANPGPKLTEEQAKEFLLIQLRAHHV